MIEYEYRIASVHKTPQKVLEILKEYENEKNVYVTVAGSSNALSAFVDAKTTSSVIACPSYSEKFGGTDTYSSLRASSGIRSLLVPEREGSAIAASKIFALDDETQANKAFEYQTIEKEEIDLADKTVRKSNGLKR